MAFASGGALPTLRHLVRQRGDVVGSSLLPPNLGPNEQCALTTVSDDNCGRTRAADQQRLRFGFPTWRAHFSRLHSGAHKLAYILQVHRRRDPHYNVRKLIASPPHLLANPWSHPLRLPPGIFPLQHGVRFLVARVSVCTNLTDARASPVALSRHLLPRHMQYSSAPPHNTK